MTTTSDHPAVTEAELEAETARVYEELLEDELWRPFRERARMIAADRLRGYTMSPGMLAGRERSLGRTLVLDVWPDCPLPPLGNSTAWYVPSGFEIDGEGVWVQVYGGERHWVCSPCWPWRVNSRPAERRQSVIFGARPARTKTYTEAPQATVSVAVRSGSKWKEAEIRSFADVAVLERAGLKINPALFTPKTADSDELRFATAPLVTEFLTAAAAGQALVA